MRWLRARLARARSTREAGLTLVELLVAAAMSVVLVGAAG
jgi:Tfp pilus assembly protein PilW